MFYVIDNRLITICQRFVWHIELFTSLGRKGVAKLIIFVHFVFTAIFSFFMYSAHMSGTYEALAMNIFFLVPLFTFHLQKLVSMRKMKKEGNLVITGEEWRRPEATVKRREIRKIIFAVSVFIPLLFLYIFSLSGTDLDQILLWISVIVVVSPWITFLSEYFFCTVSLPLHAREWRGRGHERKDEDIW